MYYVSVLYTPLSTSSFLGLTDGWGKAVGRVALGCTCPSFFYLVYVSCLRLLSQNSALGNLTNRNLFSLRSGLSLRSRMYGFWWRLSVHFQHGYRCAAPSSNLSLSLLSPWLCFNLCLSVFLCLSVSVSPPSLYFPLLFSVFPTNIVNLVSQIVLYYVSMLASNSYFPSFLKVVEILPRSALWASPPPYPSVNCS